MIKDVKLENLVVRSDDRGYLIEILRATDPHFTKFGQVYLVGNLTRGTIRAFHKHDELWDWFFISHGCAKFALVDDRPESPTYKETNTFIIGDRQPGLLVVPPGVYHGWMSLQDDTQLISTGSEVYNRDKTDEVRVPFDSFGYDWSVQFK
ncbi:MAG TPA: dTDP-4-dehydrorhamnose 3,5-epimerase family protein [Candidatus Deferrimicrobiaceae bacterium]|jgi:dTDP-4-dehydrorhamnose 3,5-epimerase